MKTLKFKFIAFLIALSAVTACSLDNDGDNYCFYQGQMGTTAVTGPETTTVNTPITFNVTFIVANSCGVFNRFVESNGFPKEVVALVDYTGCECTPTPTATQTKPYTFTATTAGTYELRFLKEGTNQYFTKVITVTE